MPSAPTSEGVAHHAPPSTGLAAATAPATSRAEARQFAAVTAGEPNETYLGMRLTYRDEGSTERGFATRVSGWTLVVLIFRAGLVAFLVGFVGFVLAVLFSAASRPTTSSQLQGELVVVLLLVVILPLAAFVLMFFIPYREQLSDWTMMVEGRAGSAEQAFAAVYDALRRRQVPAEISPRRIRSGFAAGYVNNYIVARTGRYRAFASLLPYGTDLFMSWSMWRTQTPIQMLFRYIAETVGGLFGKDHLHVLMEAEPARALRESLHNAMREGVEAAASGRSVDVDSTFGRVVPIESAPLNTGR